MSKDLRQLERVWHTLGRQDPFWAALTDPTRQHGGWSAEEFFRTGELEIESIFERAGRYGRGDMRGRALDFGCGAGRLSQALAARFTQVDGVDISGPMIEVAERYNRHGDRCRYHHRKAPDLSDFPDATFDFIYSVLTLQHIPPIHAQAYIDEFVRVLAPDGLLVFQVPGHRAPLPPRRAAIPTAAAAPLPGGAFAAVVTLESDVGEWTAGETRLLHVSVRNTSEHTWRAASRSDGLFRIQVGNRWCDATGRVIVPDDGRTPLPHDVAPGEQVTLYLEARAPIENGAYTLAVDMVQEHVAWFEERGSPALRTACRVSGGQPAPSAAPTPRRFAQRLPRLHALLVAAGVDGVRGAIKRARARARTGRWQRAAMVMHCIPRAEVIALLERRGARALDIEEELTPGGYQDCRYWIVKRR